MVFSTKVVALAACAALAVSVFELVRTKRIREEYSLMWFAATVALVLLIVFDDVALSALNLVGGVNLSSLFFLAGVFFSVMLLLHLTVQISDLRRRQNTLVQEAGLLRQELESFRQAASDDRERAT